MKQPYIAEGITLRHNATGDHFKIKTINGELVTLHCDSDNFTMNTTRAEVPRAFEEFGPVYEHVQQHDDAPAVTIEYILERCPFCGSTHLDPASWMSDADVNNTGPGCMDCGATSESVELWNRRYMPAPDHRVAQIMAAADEFGHVYAFVGDDTMPRYRKALETLVRRYLEPADPVGELTIDGGAMSLHLRDGLDCRSGTFSLYHPGATPRPVQDPGPGHASSLMAGVLHVPDLTGYVPVPHATIYDAQYFVTVAEALLNPDGDTAAYLNAAGKPDTVDDLRKLLADAASRSKLPPGVAPSVERNKELLSEWAQRQTALTAGTRLPTDDCRQSYENTYHKVRPEITYDHWEYVWKKATANGYDRMTEPEIKALTAMIWGAPVIYNLLRHTIIPVIRQYEDLRAIGARPVDPATVPK